MRRIVIGVLVAVASLPAGAAVAAEPPGYVVTRGCDEHQAFVVGDDAAVAARLPEGYEPVRDRESGRPVLFARAIRCDEATLGSHTGPVTLASYGITVETPDGWGCGTGTPLGELKGDVPAACNWYTLAWLADDKRLVRWLRGDGDAFPASHTTALQFELGAGTFRFVSSADGAPFGMDAATRERDGEIPIRGGYWADSAAGTVKLAFSTEDLEGGDATGTVTAPPGSELATLMGAGERRYLPGYSAFAAERWQQGIYRRQALPAGSGSHSFAGSCAFSGDVTFEPPASNTPQPLEYGYEASGTCTGTLDGREVSEVPVEVSQAGRSYGSCSGAHTTQPGHGRIAFASGEMIAYTLDFTSTSTEIDFDFYGERSGMARGHGSFLTPRTSPEVAAQCRGGGVSRIPMDTTLRTDQPLVSEPAPVAPRGGTATAGPAPRLRLAVAPRSARAGRRTVFAFRVLAADGSPVAGAVVRFAGRRARAGRRGRTRIAAVVRRPGRRTARATKAGFLAARTSVLVR
jgi:hypothetical protein